MTQLKQERYQFIYMYMHNYENQAFRRNEVESSLHGRPTDSSEVIRSRRIKSLWML